MRHDLSSDLQCRHASHMTGDLTAENITRVRQGNRTVPKLAPSQKKTSGFPAGPYYALSRVFGLKVTDASAESLLSIF
jgi:hypothetical protein